MGFATVATLDLPIHIRVQPHGVCELRIMFDSRICTYAPWAFLFSADGSSIRRVAAEQIEQSTISFRMSATTVVEDLILRPVLALAYPDEAIEGPQAARIEVVGDQHSTVTAAVRTAAISSAVGVQSTVSWLQVPGRTGDRRPVPVAQAVELVSVGPDPVPAGLRTVIRADPLVVRKVSLLESDIALITVPANEDDSIGVLTLETQEEVAAGARMRLQLAYDVLDTWSSNELTRISTVDIVVPEVDYLRPAGALTFAPVTGGGAELLAAQASPADTHT